MQRLFHQKSCCGQRKDEARPLVRASALTLKVGWQTKKLHSINPQRVSSGTGGRPRRDWLTHVYLEKWLLNEKSNSSSVT